MKVHHCFIRLIQHYRFSILCQFPTLPHKPYDKLHTLLKFPNLDSTMREKMRGYLHRKQVGCKLSPSQLSYFSFQLELHRLGSAGHYNLPSSCRAAGLFPALRKSRRRCHEQVTGSVCSYRYLLVRELCQGCMLRRGLTCAGEQMPQGAPNSSAARSQGRRALNLPVSFCREAVGLRKGNRLSQNTTLCKRGKGAPLFPCILVKGLQRSHQLLVLLIEVGKLFCFPSCTIWSLTVLPELIFYFFFSLS